MTQIGHKIIFAVGFPVNDLIEIQYWSVAPRFSDFSSQGPFYPSLKDILSLPNLMCPSGLPPENWFSRDVSFAG